jgi:hypothetical protein
MCTECGCRDQAADWIPQGTAYGGLLERAGDTAEDAVGCEQTWNGESERVGRDVVEVLEAAIIDLLLAAGCV